MSVTRSLRPGRRAWTRALSVIALWGCTDSSPAVPDPCLGVYPLPTERVVLRVGERVVLLMPFSACEYPVEETEWHWWSTNPSVVGIEDASSGSATAVARSVGGAEIVARAGGGSLPRVRFDLLVTEDEVGPASRK